MAVEVVWEVPAVSGFDDAFFSRVAEACFCEEGIGEAFISITIVSPEAIRAINLERRGVDRPTDVLSFPQVSYAPGKTARTSSAALAKAYDPFVGFTYLGDCVLNWEQATEQARAYGHALEREVGYLVAHSAFHLMGYDHMTDADRALMRRKEERTMARLALARPF